VLQHVAACCSVLQCVAVCCSVLQCVAVRCCMLHCDAVCCSVLQYVAVCCSVLQCVGGRECLAHGIAGINLCVCMREGGDAYRLYVSVCVNTHVSARVHVHTLYIHCMYWSIRVCMLYACVCCVHTLYVLVYKRVCVYSTLLWACTHVRMYVYTYVRMYVCIFARLYVCTYTYVHMYVCKQVCMYIARGSS